MNAQPNVRLTYGVDLRKDQTLTLAKRVAKGFGMPGGAVSLERTHSLPEGLMWRAEFRGLYFDVIREPGSTVIVCYPVHSEEDPEVDPWLVPRMVHDHMGRLFRGQKVEYGSQEYRGPFPAAELPAEWVEVPAPWWYRLACWVHLGRFRFWRLCAEPYAREKSS